MREYLPVLRLLVTHRALKFWLDAAFEADVSIEAVGPCVSIATA